MVFRCTDFAARLLVGAAISSFDGADWSVSAFHSAQIILSGQLTYQICRLFWPASESTPRAQNWIAGGVEPN
jgi:hypothetical protein